VDGGKTTLTSPMLDLTRLAHPRVRYWRWYTNHLGAAPNADTWLVQVSNDGGVSWTDLERTTVSANSWQEQSFVLEEYVVPSVQMVFRFVASDVGDGSQVEAALDDFEIEGDVQAVAVELPAAPAAPPHLEPPRPNPASGGAALAFTLPAAGRAALRLFAADGRLVRTLVDRPLPAGRHQVVWEGRDQGGRRVAPGVYFCLLEASGKEVVRRITLLR
jgi:hypothetical protein